MNWFVRGVYVRAMPPLRHKLVVLFFLAAFAAGCASTPSFQGMTSEEIFQVSTEYLEAEEWDDAILGFERLLFAFPTFERAPQARLHLAEAFFGKEQYLTAISEYERFLDRYSSHDLAPEAALGICRSNARLSPIPQRDQSYTEQAVISCTNVAGDFPGTAAAQQAREIRDRMVAKLAEKDYQRGNHYFRRGFYDSAIIFLEDVLERYPDTPAAPKALLRMYESYVEIGYEEDAAAARERLLRDYPDSPAAQELLEGNVDGSVVGGADLPIDVR